jgi:hypothetical protein
MGQIESLQLQRFVVETFVKGFVDSN